MNDGWITHNGGPCPVAHDAVVEVRFAGLWKEAGYASSFNWKHSKDRTDIIAYRLVTIEPAALGAVRHHAWEGPAVGGGFACRHCGARMAIEGGHNEGEPCPGPQPEPAACEHEWEQKGPLRFCRKCSTLQHQTPEPLARDMTDEDWRLALLAKFPALNLSWAPEVQSKWLECFALLAALTESSHD